MKKYHSDYISRFNERVNCECCGKQMRLGEKACGFIDTICVECARNGYRDKNKKRK